MATRTALEVITDAFHKMGLVSEDESITAEQSSRALYTLNDLMQGFEAEGIQYQHSDLLISSTVNLPDHLIWSLSWLLTEVLADEYGKELTPRQMIRCDRARAALQAYFYEVPPAQLDEGTLRTNPVGTISITRA